MSATGNKFSKEDFEKKNIKYDLKISPLRKDGVIYGTPAFIWNVVADDNLYVKANNETNSRWYQSA